MVELASPNRATATERPTRWQNVWRAVQTLDTAPGVLAPITAGDLILVRRLHPSADIARTVARAEIAAIFASRCVFGSYDPYVSYVGAFPEGHDPESYDPTKAVADD